MLISNCTISLLGGAVAQISNNEKWWRVARTALLGGQDLSTKFEFRPAKLCGLHAFCVWATVLLILTTIPTIAFASESLSSPPVQSPSYWIGHTKVDLIDSWGVPDRMWDFANGAAVLAYSRSQRTSGSIDIKYRGYSWQSTKKDIPEYLNFIVDKEGKIINFRFVSHGEEAETDWVAIGVTVGIVGLIVLFLYWMHMMSALNGLD